MTKHLEILINYGIDNFNKFINGKFKKFYSIYKN